MRKAIVVAAVVCLLAMPVMAGINDSHGGLVKTSGSAGLSTSAVAQADFSSVTRPNDSHGGLSVSDSGVSSVELSPTVQSLLFILSRLGLFSSFIL
jgi:hypothetical protein